MYKCATWQQCLTTPPTRRGVHVHFPLHVRMYTCGRCQMALIVTISCPSPPRFCSPQFSPQTFLSICSISETSLIPLRKTFSASSTSRVCFWTKPTWLKTKKQKKAQFIFLSLIFFLLAVRPNTVCDSRTEPFRYQSMWSHQVSNHSSLQYQSLHVANFSFKRHNIVRNRAESLLRRFCFMNSEFPSFHLRYSCDVTRDPRGT